MMKAKYRYDKFIPKSFVIGLAEDGTGGFPTMRDEDGVWRNVGIFERHCGFKPFTQKSAVTEVNKALSLRVTEIENTPIGGFKLLSLVQKPVYRSTYFGDDSHYATLHDPRGWDVSISIEELQKLLNANECNLNDGELTGIKLVYSWKKSSGVFFLDVVDEHTAEIQNATDEYVSLKDSIPVIKPSQFKIGSIYTSRTSKMIRHMYMFLGKHDVYSKDLHLDAVMREDYSCMKDFADDRNDITGNDKFVFYCIDIDKADETDESSFNTPGKSPYFVTKSLSKLFDKEETGVDLSKFTMHNSDKPCTYENILDDMKRSALFNLVDFDASCEYVDADYEACEDTFANLNGIGEDTPQARLKAFPFQLSDYGVFLNSRNYGYITILGYDRNGFKNTPCYAMKTAEMRNDWRAYNSRKTYREYDINCGETKKDLFIRAFKDIAPKVKQYVFQNGMLVPPHQNLMLNTRTKSR